jgi:hypothetical protein
MKNAMKYGYIFEVIRGYKYRTGDIFSGYVNKLYNMRKEYDKSHPMNFIAKLLLNSLYGKFGMKTSVTVLEQFDVSTEKGRNFF